jgi:hypothetical protein
MLIYERLQQALPGPEKRVGDSNAAGKSFMWVLGPNWMAPRQGRRREDPYLGGNLTS